MVKKISSCCLGYSTYLLFFIAYLVVFIYLGFLLRININSWTLIAAFVSYNFFLGIGCLISKSRNKYKQLIVGMVVTPLLFLLLTFMFGHTYDLSYDGEDYHQSAVIALSKRWDPLYQKAPPINPNNPIDKPLDEGYGKTVWAVDASIYQLTHNIDSAAAINLIAALIALSFVLAALLDLGIDQPGSLLLSFAAVFTTIFIEQTFTLREDALSYELLLVGLSSLILLRKRKNKAVFLGSLAATLVLIASIKDSNLFPFTLLAVLSLCVIIKLKLYAASYFKPLVVATSLAALLLLWNPYATNIYQHRSIDYPFNTPLLANSLKLQNIPVNLASNNRGELFFYGIFSQASLSNSHSTEPAHLKVPFSLTVDDLSAEASVSAKTVGGYGVFFSGILVISLGAYVYLLMADLRSKNRTTLLWLTGGILLIVGSCLLSPVPNYSRYISQLYLIPVAVAAVLLMTGAHKLNLRTFLGLAITSLLLANVLIDGCLSYAYQYDTFKDITTQLNGLAESKQTYEVYDGAFYSSYLKLRSHGVKLVESPKPIGCTTPIILNGAVRTAVLCKTGH